MVCSTVKPGIACVFMSAKGCSFNGGTCYPAIEQCEGCDRTKDFGSGKYCLSSPDPSQKWKLGNCNLATHIKKTPVQPAAKINPLKASKRSAR
jgi:hypothetical protein